MGPLEKVGSPFMLEGHSHWAPSSVWRKELPSCLLWQNLPEDSDTIAHLAPCFLSFFFLSYWNFPPSRHDLSIPSLLTCVKWDSIDQGHCLLNWPSEGPWTMWGHRHRYPVTPTDAHEAQGPTCMNSTPSGSSWKGDELEEEKALSLWDMLHECRGLAGGPGWQRGWQIPEIVRCLPDHPLGQPLDHLLPSVPRSHGKIKAAPRGPWDPLCKAWLADPGCQQYSGGGGTWRECQ